MYFTRDVFLDKEILEVIWITINERLHSANARYYKMMASSRDETSK